MKKKKINMISPAGVLFLLTYMWLHLKVDFLLKHPPRIEFTASKDFQKLCQVQIIYMSPMRS